MLSLPELILKVKVDDSGAKTGLKGIENQANQATTSAEGKFTKLGTVIKGVLAAEIVKKFASAMVDLGKQAVNAYADFEQLSGGVEKIFGKDSAKTVQKNAQRAFETAGISANQYMEQVTSFSASLLQSLGGDTEKAASIADMAIQDMSDNANTFGTDMQSIQNAYQGFAKQNYTMLDNLKLGYGGTKTEMERLLADAEKLTGVHYDISNLSDVYNAIHAIQEETNITGTTTREAAKTIEGSVNSMKASWTNFLTALGTGDDKAVTDALGNFITSLGNVAKNLGPALLRIGKSIVKLLYDGIKKAFSGGGLESLGSTLVNKVTGLVNTLAAKLPTLIPILYTKVTELMQSLLGKVQGFLDGSDGSGDTLNKILEAVKNLLSGIVTGLINAFPIVLKAMPKLLLAIIKIILTWPIKLIKMGWQLLKALVSGLVDGVKNAFPGFIKAIAKAWEDVKAKIKEKIDKIKDVWNAVKFAAKSAVVKLKDKLTEAKDKVKKAWEEFKADPKTFIMKALDKASELIKKVKDIWESFTGGTKTVTVNHQDNYSTSNGGGTTKKKNTKPKKRHRAGIDFIPRDEYPALLHYGEAVLSRSEANAWRKQQAMAGRVAASRASEQPIIVNTDLYIDGRKIASTTAQHMKKAIDKISTADNRQLGLV